jgi:TPR repeat protein
MNTVTVNISPVIEEYHKGVAYFHGEEHPWFNPSGIQDYEKALNYFMSAIENGSSGEEIAEAYNYIGIIFQNGFGVNEDKKKAFEYFQTAAEMGSWRGAEHLALKYYWGECGVEKNIEKAMMWFYMAWQKGSSQDCIDLVKEEAAKGNRDAQWCLGEIIYSSYHSSIPDNDLFTAIRLLLLWYTIPEIKESVKLLQSSAEQGQKFALKFYQSLNITKRTVYSVMILIVILVVILFFLI